ncbi:hypothetical protein RUM43_009535 [Polyplax serrata]|uniref:Uncharacterized protein n=1 Tax=Polyplax serrata TaxID=468196 RepID=A0AAN8PAX1_POLSC
MYAKVCPLCKTKFYSAKKNVSGPHKKCGYKKLKEGKKSTFRTSTPVSDIENISSSFSDSVLDFFYQTWKSGLIAESTISFQNQNFRCSGLENFQAQQPVFWYSAGQVVYYGTVVYQSVIPSSGVYFQPVGYRPDGTFGVLPYIWP